MIFTIESSKGSQILTNNNNLPTIYVNSDNEKLWSLKYNSSKSLTTTTTIGPIIGFGDALYVSANISGLQVPKKRFFSNGFLLTQAEKRTFSQLKAYIST